MAYCWELGVGVEDGDDASPPSSSGVGTGWSRLSSCFCSSREGKGREGTGREGKGRAEGRALQLRHLDGGELQRVP